MCDDSHDYGNLNLKFTVKTPHLAPEDVRHLLHAVADPEHRDRLLLDNLPHLPISFSLSAVSKRLIRVWIAIFFLLSFDSGSGWVRFTINGFRSVI